ncbi:hypothetical protein HKCCE2091_09880 [Rhodobacterales bacterium HKCCE2091]|nr:hypothetical protein [Rhodobacterales bacterium HKCCE2091]
MPKNFLTDESGAVTVDFVVLTGAIVMLGLAALGVVSQGTADLSNDTSAEIASIDAGALPFGDTATGPLRGVDLSTYDTYDSRHDANWLSGTYSGWSDLEDDDIMNRYNQSYGIATATMDSGTIGYHEGAHVDYVAVLETIMVERNMEVPSDNYTATEIRAAYN